MKSIPLAILVLGIACPLSLHAQQSDSGSFEEAAADIERRLNDSLVELSGLQKDIAADIVPLSTTLSELQAEFNQVRQESLQVARELDERTLELTNLTGVIERRENEAAYLANLLGDYVRQFETRLHVAEEQRYDEQLAAAKLALENDNLSTAEVFAAQVALLETSIERLLEALGGTRFDGTAVDSGGRVLSGSFLKVGPSVIFRSDDGQCVGTVERRLNSAEPAAIAFARPEDALAAEQVLATGAGLLPLDSTRGDALKVESTEETLWEHVQKGGAVMIPIFALAALALLIGLYKWLSLAFIRKPSQRAIQGLLEAVAERDEELAKQRAAAIKGPVGRMLSAGAEHLREPRELIEEVMFETVLVTRLRLQRMLSFIAISAASAPLLGLLGTVTGIINTFRMITVFGSSDVKSLSGGISEALITTKFGLIVAIPSLLLHAFLSRKTRSVIGQMDTAAVALLNQVGKTPLQEPATRVAPETVAFAAPTAASVQAGLAGQPGAAAASSEFLRAQIQEILSDMLHPVPARQGLAEGGASAAVGVAVGPGPIGATASRAPAPGGE